MPKPIEQLASLEKRVKVLEEIVTHLCEREGIDPESFDGWDDESEAKE